MAEQKLTRGEKNWILYDVANSAFIMLVSTTIPIFFRSLAEGEGLSPEQATGVWGTVTSAAVLILAVLSPILGAVADYKGMKKKMFLTSLLLGIAGLLAMSFAGEWVAFLVLFVIARVGYSASNIFYDSMLTDVTTDEKMDMVSSHGFAWGYIGSCIPFIIGIVLIFTTPFGLTTQTATQLSFLVTAVWWFGLTIPLLKTYRQTYYLEGKPERIRDIFHQLGDTFQKIRKNKQLLFYILAYFCYIDGVNTIISMSTSYGDEMGISSSAMIFALLLTQFIAFPCAIISGKLAKIWVPAGPGLGILGAGGGCGPLPGGNPGSVPVLLREADPQGSVQRIFRIFRYFREVCGLFRPADYFLLRLRVPFLQLWSAGPYLPLWAGAVSGVPVGARGPSGGEPPPVIRRGRGNPAVNSPRRFNYYPTAGRLNKFAV